MACFRLGLATIILCDLVWYRLPNVGAFYADDGMYPLAAAKAWLGDAGGWSLCLLDGSPEFQTAMFVLTGLFALALLVGWQTRLATIGCWVMLVSIANRNALVTNYGDSIMQIFLFWSFFLPLGGKWSLDARRQNSRQQNIADQPAHPTSVCSMASAVAMLQLCLIYFFAALWKWNSDWLSGSAVETAFLLEYARRESPVDLLQYKFLLRPLTIATLFLELLGPLIVWIPYRTNLIRYAMIGAFSMLHISIELYFTPLLLSYVCVVAWLLFLPASFWETRFVRRITRNFCTTNDNSTVVTAGFAQPVVMSPFTRLRHRFASCICLVLFVYVVMWNTATLNPKRFGFLIPQQIAWVGHVTMLGQTWDMFSRPSQHNGWFKARARLASQDTVDLLRDGEPFDRDSLASNWAYYKGSRWKMFFRRLGIWKESEPICNHVAEYLLTQWNQQHPDERRAVELSFMYYERLGDPQANGYTVRQMGSANNGEQQDWEVTLD
ncbi:MAG: HTTM domain-containing protein, partial [Rubripirellula sp.]|nr:HTTM domain-containing protein [Rubripirellula sp.]